MLGCWLSRGAAPFCIRAISASEVSFFGANGDSGGAGVWVCVGVTSKGWVSWPAGAPALVGLVGVGVSSMGVACSALSVVSG